jgi:hypothetical protein
MSAGAESFVRYSRGPMNTGTGHQFNGLTFVINTLEQLVRRGRDPRHIAREHLLWLHRRFIEPSHFGRAGERLEVNGSVLLTGAPGSGRRSAAQMLLYRLPGAEVQIRELLPDADPEDPSGKPMLDASAVDSGQRLLLDLSTTTKDDNDEKYCAEVLEQVPSYRDVVRERGAHLVVALPRSHQHYLDLEFESSVVDIVRPKGREVFQRYLRSDGIQPTSAQLDVNKLTEQLDSAPMRHIANLARLVQCFKEAEPRQEFSHWLSEALKALTGYSGDIAEQMTYLRSGQQRALLLATAMFSGAHADAVFEATSTLRKTVQHPEDDRPRLEREDLAAQLTEIKAKADDAGRVRFELPDYDRAVRIHFWTNRPDERELFRNWVGTALRHGTLSSEDRDKVVTRFAEQALRTGRPADLVILVERWLRRTDVRGPSHLLPQAAKAVVRGLSDERHGRFFRQQLYTWSTNPGLSPDLAQVVVQMCAEVLAQTHPEQALVRLHHILRRHSGVSGTTARTALLGLVRDRRLYRRLLDRVMSGLMTTENAAADLALFLDLADPAQLTDSQRRTQPLIADEAVQDQLVTGWRAVLDGSLSPSRDHRVETWLVACGDDHRYRELLLDVLVKAGDGRGDLLSRLYVIARNWADAPDDRQAERSGIADRLTNKIDSALGIDFTELDLGDRTEGTSP